jgi:hypothetical protein
LQLCLFMLSQNTHTYIYSEPGQVHSYRLQYFFISVSVKVKLYNNRLYNAADTFTTSIAIFRNGIFHWPVKRINLITGFEIPIYGSAFFRYF